MDDYYSPSVIDIISCDKLKDGLREAIRYLLENLKHIQGFNKVRYIAIDETILILDTFIEYNYLRSYGASYAENLYNLIRLSRSTNAKIRNILPSLISITLIPYIKRKLDIHFESLNYKENRTAEDLQRIRLYKIFTRSCTFFNLIYLLRYSSGRAHYHTLIDGLLDICLKVRIEERDDIECTSVETVEKTCKKIADFTGRILTVGSYVIQFLDYWNTHNNSAPIFNVSWPTPKPPSKEDMAYNDEKSSNLCLICLHVRQNECALSNTGYVFCYKCLHRYVTAKQRCPVTDHPTTDDNIVKLFTSTPF